MDQDSQKPLASHISELELDHGSLTLLATIFSMLSFLAVSVFLFLVYRLTNYLPLAFWLFSVEMISTLHVVFILGRRTSIVQLDDSLYMMVGQWVDKNRSFDICCSGQAPIKWSLKCLVLWWC